MPSFVYNSNSAVNSLNYKRLYADGQVQAITYNEGLFHYLTIVLSNCTYNGNVFVSAMESLEALIQAEFSNISNLEFRGVGCSMMRGNTDSLTLGIAAGYYSDVANLTETEALTLRVASNDAISNISGFVVSEVRVETTLRQQSTY